MKKTIGVYFREIKLGELSKVNDNYVYKSNEENVKQAHEKGYSSYLYKCDDSFISTELPYSLQNFVPDEKQTQIVTLAKITKNDSDFDKLYKVAKLNLVVPDFHIKA